jgi:mRNA-degrading endonuclease YafQ of YafQ-DinJ toxin-antitoxin module
MRKVVFTDTFNKQAKKLIKKNPQLRGKIAKQFKIFSTGDFHPSIKLHKLKGSRSSQYAIWIEGDLRAVSVKERGVYVFFELAKHDEY